MCCVVVIGFGIVFSIGNNVEEVFVLLKVGKFGIIVNEDMKEYGFCSQVVGVVNLDIKEVVDKCVLCFMGLGVVYGYIVMQQVIVDVGLFEVEVVNLCIGLIVGFGGFFIFSMFVVYQIVLNFGLFKWIGLFVVLKCMFLMILVNFLMVFRIKGVNYLIILVCLILLYCIGNVVEQIVMGCQDVMFVGGVEELDWMLSCLFDVMGVMLLKYNDQLEKVLCVFDVNCDGFVILGGGGIIVLEELEYVKVCGVKIYVEVMGYVVILDGYDMVVFLGEGGECVMCLVLEMLKDGCKISYINVYGILILVGDVGEVEVVCCVFGEGQMLLIFFIKLMIGYSQGVIGV